MYCVKEIKRFLVSRFSAAIQFIPGLLPIGNGTILASAFYQPLKLVSADGTISEPKVNIQDFERCIQRSVFIPTDLYKDSSGNIWIGTVSNGLMCYSPESEKVTPFPGQLVQIYPVSRKIDKEIYG